MPSRRNVMTSGLAMILAGCTSLATLREATAPQDLYQLTPKSTFDADLPSVDAQIVIEIPTAASGLNTDRIAVKPNPFQVQYFGKARWVDRAPLLVQTLMVESFENSDRVGSVGRQAIGLSSDYTLLTDLREFQVEAVDGDTAKLMINTQLNMKIVKEPRGVIIASRSFGERLPAASPQMLDVVRAFDQALGRSLRDAVTWAILTIDADEG